METIILEAETVISDSNTIKEMAGVIREDILEIWAVVSHCDNNIPNVLHPFGSIKIPQDHPFLFLKKGAGSCYLSHRGEIESVIEIGAEIEVSLPTQKVRGEIERVFCLGMPRRFVFIIEEWWIEIEEKANDECVIAILPKNPSVTFMKLEIDKI